MCLPMFRHSERYFLARCNTKLRKLCHYEKGEEDKKPDFIIKTKNVEKQLCRSQ